jgi:hypothetical protein
MKKLIVAAPLVFAIACSSGGGSADADGDGEISQEEAEAEVQSANINITPGQWENTVQLTEFDVPDMPDEMRAMVEEEMGRARTTTSCITPEEASNPEANMFGGEDEEDCTYSEFTMSNGTILIAGSCDPVGGGATAMRMEGNYTATSYNMNMNVEADAGPMGSMAMAGQVTGRYLGPDCGADSDG